MPDTGKTYKYKASDGEHVHQLNQAFSTIVSLTSDVSIISEDQKEIQSNRSFLGMFSPTLRDILCGIPDYISPTIILPDCSSTSINHLLKFITGNSMEFENFKDGRAMLQTASVLGVEIQAQSLRFLNGSKSESMDCDREDVEERNISKNISKSESMDCDREDVKERNISKNIDAKGEALLESSNEEETEMDQDNSIASKAPQDSGINSFLETSTSSDQTRKGLISSTPKQKQNSNPIVQKASNNSQDLIKTTAAANKEDHAMDEDASNVPIQPHQIKQEMVNFNDVSPKELIAKQAVHRICQIPTCAKNVPSLGKLRDHYLNHFWDEFVKKYGKFVDDKICLLCSKVFGSRSSSLKHVAIWHSKINEILTSKNYLPLPLQLNIKDQSFENDQSLNVNLPFYRKQDVAEQKEVDKVTNISAVPTPKKSSLLDRSIDRVKKNVSFEETPPKKLIIENAEDKTKPVPTKSSAEQELQSQIGEKSVADGISENTGDETSNQMDESFTVLYDNLEPINNSNTLQVKQEPLEAAEDQEDSQTPEQSTIAMKPHEVKREVFEFDNNVVPKDIIAEQSVHKVCQVCLKSEPVLGKLRDHYVGHFIKEIEERYGKFVDDKSCTFCTPPSVKSSRSAVLRHIATWHSKVNSILTSKNLLPLPLTLNVKDTESENVKSEGIGMSQQKTVSGQPMPSLPTQNLQNLGFPCKLCNTNQKSFSALRYHFYQKHFKTEVNSKFGHLADTKTGLICLVCNNEKAFKNKQATMNHIALIHSKINEVINDKGLHHLLVANPWVGGKSLNENQISTPPAAEKIPEKQNKPETLVRTEKSNQSLSRELMVDNMKSLIKIKETAPKPLPTAENQVSKSITTRPESKTDASPMQTTEVTQPEKGKTVDEMLTEEFLKDRFLTKERTKLISEKVKMSESEVWKWFYNARQKKPEEIKAKLDSVNEPANKQKATKDIVAPVPNSNNKPNSGLSEFKELRLKKEFYLSRHLNKERTRNIAAELKLTEDQVEQWFAERSKVVPQSKPTMKQAPIIKQNNSPASVVKQASAPTPTTKQTTAYAPTREPFTVDKVKKLNNEFKQSQDLSRERSKSLAKQLGMTEKQIIQWFTTKTRSNNYSRGTAKESQPPPVIKPSMTINQLLRLEKEFNSNQLKTKEIRRSVSTGINLTEQDIEQWLQNRIMVRKQFAGEAEKTNSSETKLVQKRSPETELNKEAKRGKTNTIVDKVIKTEREIKTEKEIDPAATETKKDKSKIAYSCDCGESFLSDEAFGIHKTYTCKNLS